MNLLLSINNSWRKSRWKITAEPFRRRATFSKIYTLNSKAGQMEFLSLARFAIKNFLIGKFLWLSSNQKLIIYFNFESSLAWQSMTPYAVQPDLSGWKSREKKAVNNLLSDNKSRNHEAVKSISRHPQSSQWSTFNLIDIRTPRQWKHLRNDAIWFVDASKKKAAN